MRFCAEVRCGTALAWELNRFQTESPGVNVSVASPDWFAVYTKPRQEQIALANLERQAFQCYLPLVDALQSTRAQRTAKPSARSTGPRAEPLFPRYLFLNAAPERQSLASVRSTRGVVSLVRAGVELIRVPAAIIAGLMSRMDAGNGLIALDDGALHAGERVQVFDGPFAAMEGVFKEYRGRSRSLLLLEILGRETAVEVEARLLHRVG